MQEDKLKKLQEGASRTSEIMAHAKVQLSGRSMLKLRVRLPCVAVLCGAYEKRKPVKTSVVQGSHGIDIHMLKELEKPLSLQNQWFNQRPPHNRHLPHFRAIDGL